MRKVKLVDIILLLILIVACLSWPIYSLIKYYRNDRMVLEDISQRIGIEPDWLSVREYVYCEILVPGKDREQVEAELEEIGDFHGGGYELTTEIDFADPSIYTALSPLGLVYDEHWELVRAGPMENNLGPHASCEGTNRWNTPTPVR